MGDGFSKIAGLTIFLLISLIGGASGATLTMNVSATVLSKNQCRFTTNAATLAFGTLAAGSPAPPDVLATAILTVRCQGKDDPATFLITDDDGLYESAVDSPRMQNTDDPLLPPAYLPYKFSYTPISATVPTKVDQTVTVSATVRGFDYKSAVLGFYSDTITLSVLP